jgi:hypothetical protein
VVQRNLEYLPSANRHTVTVTVIDGMGSYLRPDLRPLTFEVVFQGPRHLPHLSHGLNNPALSVSLVQQPTFHISIVSSMLMRISK